jgi:hypothetical protein
MSLFFYFFKGDDSMAIDTFRDPLYIKWYTDSQGNKISVERLNEQYQIVKNKITLAEIPDEFDKVQIDNFYEVKSGKTLDINEFSVNYTLGEITFHESHEAETITIKKYKSRGIIYYPASRVYSEYDPETHEIKETLQNVVNNMTHRGEYSNIVQYYPRNIVYYAGGSYMCIKRCINIPPSNTSYWQQLTLPGLDLVFRGEYDHGLSYDAKDAVSYGGSIYYCLTSSTGHLPTDTNYWSIFMPKSIAGILKNTVTFNTPKSNVQIGISGFNYQNDELMVFVNSTYVEKDKDYTMNIDGLSIDKIDGSWSEDGSTTTINFLAIKNVLTTINFNDGSLIQDASVPKTKLTVDVQNKLDEIGVLSNLTTTDKTNLVGAVSEVKDEVGAHLAESTQKFNDITLNVTNFSGSTFIEKLNNAIAFCNTFGFRKLLIPQGIYDVPYSVIELPDYLELYGNGMGITILRSTSTTESIIFKAKHANNKFVKGIKLHDFTIDGNLTATEAQFFPVYSEVHHIEVTRHKTGRNLYVDTICTNLHDCLFDIKDGTPLSALYVVGNAINIHDNYLNGQLSAIPLIIDNAGISFTETTSVNIFGNTNESGGACFIKVQGSTQNVNIHDNRDEGDNLTVGGIWIAGGLHKNLKINNEFITGSAMSKAIFIDKVDPKSSFDIQFNNLYRACRIDTLESDTTSLYNLKTLPEIKFANNTHLFRTSSTNKEVTLDINGVYFMDYCECIKTKNISIGEGYNKINMGVIFNTSLANAPIDLFTIYIPPTGGTTYADAITIETNLKWRRASGNSYVAENIKTTAIARNSGTMKLAQVEHFHLNTETTNIIAATFALDTANNIVKFTGTGDPTYNNEWFLEINMQQLA